MKILVSSCLLGNNCRYDGGNNLIKSIEKLKEKHEIFAVCPEEMGGLSTPRACAEILDKKVITNKNQNVTKEFESGANKTLEIALQNDIKFAILKEKSPSCGSQKIYDGTFSKNLIDGQGITSKLLSQNGIKVYNELNFREFIEE